MASLLNDDASSTITVSWTPVPNAIGYQIFTGPQMKQLALMRMRARILHLLHNKRKKQKRARTGRHS